MGTAEGPADGTRFATRRKATRPGNIPSLLELVLALVVSVLSSALRNEFNQFNHPLGLRSVFNARTRSRCTDLCRNVCRACCWRLARPYIPYQSVLGIVVRKRVSVENIQKWFDKLVSIHPRLGNMRRTLLSRGMPWPCLQVLHALMLCAGRTTRNFERTVMAKRSTRRDYHIEDRIKTTHFFRIS